MKTRGFRIEIGDIETAISEQPGCHGVYVGVVEEAGEKSLTAWYLGKELEPGYLRHLLAKRLPHYMVPRYLMRLDVFPVTSNGKIDRLRLPRPEVLTRFDSPENFDALQAQVRGVWAGVLKMDPLRVPLESQFFQLGGNSLMAAQVCNRLSVLLGKPIRPRALFEFPRLTDFCEHIRALAATVSELPELEPSGLAMAPIMNRMLGLMYTRSVSVAKDNAYHCSTLQFSAPLQTPLLQRALNELLAQNAIFNCEFVEQNSA